MMSFITSYLPNKKSGDFYIFCGLTNCTSQSTHWKVANMINGFGNMWLHACYCCLLHVTVADLALLSNAESKFCSKHMPFCVDFNVNSFSNVLTHRDDLNCVRDFVTWLKILSHSALLWGIVSDCQSVAAKKGSFFKLWYFAGWFSFFLSFFFFLENRETIWLNQEGGWKGRKSGVSRLNWESWQVCNLYSSPNIMRAIKIKKDE
jgi:hypothetical protein